MGRDGPVVIPVSAVHRHDEAVLVVALRGDRASSARLKHDRRAAVSLNGPGFSICARCRARVLAERLPGAEHMAAFRLDVEHAWDARGPATEVDAGIRWRWTARANAERHELVMNALARLAGGG